MTTDPARDFCKCGHRRTLHPDDQHCTSKGCGCSSDPATRGGFTYSATFNRPRSDGSQP